VAFLGTAYQEKEWCGLEARRIRNLIKTSQDPRVMLLQHDHGEVDGFLGIDGFLDISHRAPEEISADILQRHSQLSTSSTNRSSGAPPADASARKRPPVLSEAARVLLVQATDDRVGAIMSTLLADGSHVQTNGKEFAEPNNLRSAARWRAAVAELQRLGLIEDRAGEKRLFFLTHEGYSVADLLQEK
jgi:hypothetical protein